MEQDTTTTPFFNSNARYIGIGVDLAKRFVSVYAIDADGGVIYEPKMTHDRLVQELANVQPTHIVMEACAGSLRLAKRLMDIGQIPHVLPGDLVSRTVQARHPGKKNDKNDAATMASMAATGEFSREVTVKTERQLKLMRLLTARQQLVEQRIALINSTKGLMQEIGVLLNRHGLNPKEIAQHYDAIEADEEMKLIAQRFQMHQEQLTESIRIINSRIEELVKADKVGQMLMTIPAIGFITAAALIAVIGDARRFKSPRAVLAYVGLVPIDYSSGGKTQMGRLSKRGNSTLRWFLVSCGATLARIAKAKDGRLGDGKLKKWVLSKMDSMPKGNKLHVACAAKLLKISLAIMRTEEPFCLAKAAVSNRA